MRGRELRAALRSGKRVYGTALEGYGQARWARLFAGLGLDFVFMDSEHTPMNRETIAWAAQAYAANGIAPLLRIPEISASRAAMGVDLGAHGIIVPYVETITQVKDIIGAVKYRPLKGAALEKVLEHKEFPNDETETYLADYNPDAVLVIMIESPAGVANLPDILALGGVDAVLMGPHDLSVSHGVPEQYDHPLFLDAIKRVIAICHSFDVGVGIHYTTGDSSRAVEWNRWGMNLILHLSDSMFIARGIQNELAYLRRELDGDETQGSADHLGAGGHAT